MEPEDTFVFCKPVSVCNYVTSFKSMKEKGELCDFVYKAGSFTISAHRVILAAGIPYFKDWFTTPDVDNKSQETEMAQTDPEALVSLIHFQYTGKIEISTKNVTSLFTTSAFLRVSEIQEACWQFIQSRLTVENVMDMRKFAEHHKRETLVERLDTYILEHFGKFSLTDAFLTMPFLSLKKMIYDDCLGVESEEEVFEAVMKWMEGSGSERHAVLPELLRGVRMTKLNRTYLCETVTTNARIRESVECRDMIDEVMLYMLVEAERKHLFFKFSINPRRHYGKLYVVYTSELGSFVKFYNSENNQWSLISRNDRGDHCVDALVHSDKMYLFGGKIFESVDLKNHRWSQLKQIQENTCGTGVILHSNSIYFFGSSLYNLSQQVRRYDIFQNIWEKEGFMIEYRSAPRVASMNGSIYVAGGYPDGMFWHSGVHNSFERYDLEEKKSYSLPPMPLSRYWFGMCALKERIYICGGCDKEKHPYYLADVFDPGSNQWSTIYPMNVARYSFSLVSWKEKLYAIGGKGRCGMFTEYIEIYDPESNIWRFGLPLDISTISITSLRACTD